MSKGSLVVTPESYFYLRPSGEGHIPTRTEMVGYREQGLQPVFYLDANACIHIANYGKGEKALSPKEAEQVQSFLIALRSFDEIDVEALPGYGAVELATNPATMTLDRTEAIRIYNLVRQGLRARFRLDMAGGVFPNDKSDDIEQRMDTIEPILPLLRLHHACYLKIVDLARKKRGPRYAVENLRSFIDWLRNDLDCVPMLPLQAALAVFGGDDQWGKFCGTNIPDDAKRYRKIWSATMDTFHLQMVHFTALAALRGTPEYPMMVTSDIVFVRIFSKMCLLSGVKTGSLVTLTIGTVDHDFPNFKPRFDKTAIEDGIDKKNKESEVDELMKELATRHGDLTIEQYKQRDSKEIRRRIFKAWTVLAPGSKAYETKEGITLAQ